MDGQVIVAAMEYAALGWKVFPLSPGSKKPQPGTSGFLDATSDYTTLARLFGASPHANIGLACGPESGVWALDVDTKHDGPASLDALALEIGAAFLETRTHVTTTQGFHLFYEWDAANPMPRKINLFKGSHPEWTGLDLIGSDGYVVLPPSRIGDKSYTVADGMRPRIAPLPLISIILDALKPPATAGIYGPRVSHGPGEIREPIRHGTSGILSWLAGVQPGGQDTACAWVARALRDEGLSPREAGDLLWSAMRQLPLDGDPWRTSDVIRHINSAYK